MLPRLNLSAPGLYLGTAGAVARRRVWYRPLAAPSASATAIAAAPYVSGGESSEPTTRPTGAPLAGPLKPLMAARAALAFAALAALWALLATLVGGLGRFTSGAHPRGGAGLGTLAPQSRLAAPHLPVGATAQAYLAFYGAWVGPERRRLAHKPSPWGCISGPTANGGRPLEWSWGGIERPLRPAQGGLDGCRAYAAAWGGLLEGTRATNVGRGLHVGEGAAVAPRAVAPAAALKGGLAPAAGAASAAAVRPAAGRPAACDRSKQWAL
jgi:hypothetical protein